MRKKDNRRQNPKGGGLKAEGTGGGEAEGRHGRELWTPEDFGLFSHAAHIRGVLKCSYLVDCLGGSQPELPAPFGDFVVNLVYRLLLSITVRYLDISLLRWF